MNAGGSEPSPFFWMLWQRAKNRQLRRLWRSRVPVMLIEDPIASAGGGFESWAVEHRDHARTPADQPGLLHLAGDDLEPRWRHAEHLSEALARQLDLVVVGSVGAHQEPAGAALLHGVQPAAGNRLEDLD